MRPRLRPDPGLRARMFAVVALLVVLYAGLVYALLAAGTGMTTMLLVVGGLALAQLLLSDKLALRATGAQVVDPQEAPDLHGLVAGLAERAELPMPRVAVARTEVPNAFAMGRSQRSATVCVTSGLLRTLDRDEVEGVLAHELAHVKHRDVLVMTVASFFATIAAMVTQFGFFAMPGVSRRGEGGAPSAAVVLLVAFAVHAVSSVLMLALSRFREHGADRGAAELTGRPLALASALAKISGRTALAPRRERQALGDLQAFFIIPVRASGLFATHPPVEERIARLERYDAELRGALPGAVAVPA